MNENDLKYIRYSIDIARKSRKNGNHPFGSILVDQEGQILMEAENTVVTGKDSTGHSETNLMRLASGQYDSDFLSKCTIYTSTEPCPMCAGAIFWGNIRRVVYGLSQEGLYGMIGGDSEEDLLLPCREIFAKGKKPIEIVGPILEVEAREVHIGFWG
jgi:tRNA(Arg) A34 adenosine deaminase TadA